MLIIPAERRLDWRHPPVITLFLILINIFIYLGYQSQDSRLWQQAVGYYLEHDLVTLETPEYLHYLERRIRLEQDTRSDLPQLIRDLQEDEDQATLSLFILADRDFVRWLDAEAHRFWQDDTFAQWQTHRSQLENTWLQHLSTYRFGLAPADMGLSNLVTYQFLHGSFGHLLGNMIFLFLLGFAVEASLGKARYLLAYLSSGAISGLFFSLFEGDSLIPLVGASGSISGLMGIYVTLYRLQKIRFFFWAGVYFNYFRAPALWLLPVWIGKEVFDYLQDTSSSVAYMAHAGGLISGALIALLVGRIPEQQPEAGTSEDEQDADFRRAYSAALEAISRVDFQQARVRLTKLAEQHPEKTGLLEHLYHLEKLEPARAEFLDCADRLISIALKTHQRELAVSIYLDARKRIPSPEKVPVKWHYRLLMANLQAGELKDAESAFHALKGSAADSEMIYEGCKALADAFRLRQMATRAQQYQAVLEQLDEARLQGLARG